MSNETDVFSTILYFLFISFLLLPNLLWYLNLKNKDKKATRFVITYELVVIILLVIFTILSPYIMSSIEDDDCGWCNVSTYKGD